MKISGMPGEYLFPAIYNCDGQWKLSDGVFASLEEAQGFYKPLGMASNDHPILWPVEVQEGGIVYVPTKEELC